MANTSGIITGNSAAIPALLRIPEIRPQIVDLYRRQKLMMLMQWLGGWRKVNQETWYTVRSQPGFYSLDTTGATSITGSGTPTVTINGLTVAQSGKAIVGETVILPAGTQARIQSVTTASGLDTVVLQSYAAGTPNLTLTAGNVVRQFSNAQEEGSDAPKPRNRGFDYIYNQAGIKRHSFAATDVVKARGQKSLYVEIDGKQNAFEIGRIQEYFQHRAEVAAGLFIDQMSDPNFSNTSPTVTGTNLRGVQTTRGLLPTITQYGSIVACGTAGTPTFTDIDNVLGKIVDAEGPDNYAILGSTLAVAKLSGVLKGLGSSGTSPVRIHLDNDDTYIDFMVERFTYGGKTFDLVSVDILDTRAIFPVGSPEAKSLYFIPSNDGIPELSTSGNATTASPWVGVNYLPIIYPGLGTEMEAEVRLGALAPEYTSGLNVDQATWCSYVGLETPKPEAMVQLTGVL